MPYTEDRATWFEGQGLWQHIPESDWRQVERFGKPSLYGWSQDKARQVSVPERQDFGAFVRRQGFKLD